MTTTHDNPPPPAQVMQLVQSMWAGQAAGTLARLRVFDHIAAGAATPGAIAERIGANPEALHRVLRAGVMLGLLVEPAPRTYALTPVGQLLRSDDPHSMRALLDVETAPGHWLPWMRLTDCVKHGRSFAADALGDDVWTYYAKHPEEGRLFSEGMSGLSAAAIGAVSQVWSPPAAQTVVDVGGAHGAFLRWCLEVLPAARGVLMDLPEVLGTAAPIPRTELVGGDFFQAVPGGGDLYLLKHILHDWDDARCTSVLRNVRGAMAPGATVAIVEMLIPDDGSPSPAILLDLNMLVMLPGKERTLAELTALLATADLAVAKVVPTRSPFVVIEARAR